MNKTNQDMVRRIYVEKKAPYAVKAQELKNEMSEYLGIEAEQVRVLIRYDVENVGDDTFRTARTTFASRWSICPDSSISVPIRPSSASNCSTMLRSLSLRVPQRM